ncbi:D-alanyl-D-alanine carboxypeptidase/D-alanyl-D-alanine-endopeptidase [Burkholderiaceae bacterium DAT-1]|nr:D-alanyl-D-alanine carboxypeptidase/D-alanyl-D-alanine-endopeptidase [Burkholderiaceae bacterium DAT-1]
MLRLLPMMFFLLSAHCMAALPTSLATPLRAAGIRDAEVSVLIARQGDATPLISHRPGAAMNPASTMKVMTTAAALDLLGPAWHWQTTILTDGAIEQGSLKGNLIIRGQGDPHLTLEQVWLMLRAIRAKGIRQIEGDLILDNSYFRGMRSDDPAAFDNSPESAYNVVPDALLMNFKVIHLNLQSDDDRLTAEADPALPGLRFSSQMKLTTDHCERWRAGWQTPDMQMEGGGLNVVLKGQFPRQCTANRFLSVFDPVTFAGKLISSLWGTMGGSISGSYRQGITPVSARLLLAWPSDDLATLIRQTNKFSNNAMARMIYLTLGSELGDHALDSQTASAAVIRHWLDINQFSAEAVVTENGAGLSRTERLSAQTLVDIVQYMLNGKYAAEFISSLPLNGMDGTMQHRQGTLAGFAHFKTGTLDDVRALTGTMLTRQGDKLVVAIMVNSPQAGRANKIIDTWLAGVWENGLSPTEMEPHNASPQFAKP